MSHIRVSVGARFQGEQNPEVIIQQSSFDINDLNTSDYSTFEISVFCYANTYTEAARIADVVFAAVQNNESYTLNESELIEGSNPPEYNVSQSVYHLRGLDLFLEHYDEDGYEANVLIRAIEAQGTSQGTSSSPGTGGSPAPYYPVSTSRVQDLADVNVSSLAEGQILKYDFSEGEWVNASLPILTTGSLTQSELNGITVLSISENPSFSSISSSGDVTVSGDILLTGSSTKLIRPFDAGISAGPLTIQSNGDLIIELDQDDNEPSKAFIVKNGADAEVFKVDESGALRVNNNYTLPLTDGSADYFLKTDGNGNLSFGAVLLGRNGEQYTGNYDTEASALRSGATETVELYYTAQADGDGLAESADTDTPRSGYDIRRKLWYAEKAQADPDTSADWTQFTAIADNTTFNNAKAALLAYLKERTGGTVPISLKMTWEEVAQAPSFTGLLNESYGSGAEAAYSTRRLNGNVTDCMVIRRASDSTTTTIGFDGSGNIDESAITTFCTGTTCTVVTWKDQSGNGNDATASDPANEPTIYTGGALVKDNGKVALDFDGTSDKLSATVNFTFSGANFMVGSNQSGSFEFASSLIEDSDNQIQMFFDARSSPKRLVRYAENAVVSFMDLDSQIPQGTQTLYAYNNDNGTLRGYVDGTAVTGTISFNSITATSIDLASFLASSEEVRIQECIWWSSDKSSVRTSIESNIGDYFTQNTPLLDTYSGAAAAYSLRLLDSTYTGALINVWNGTSYADIYPNVFGELDTVALAAHCGSNNGFIRTWYDQSGNSNDAAQTTTADMPKIYDGTTGVVTENGKPTVQFDGATDYMEFGESWGAQMTMIVTWKAAATGEQQIYNMESGGVRFAMSTNRGGNSIVTRDNSGAGTSSLSGNPTITTLGITSHITNSTSTSHSLHHNNVSLTGTSSARAQNGTNTFASNSGGTSFFLNGVISEAVLYLSDKTTDRTDIEDNINTFYNIY
jgi:hypothetical protein